METEQKETEWVSKEVAAVRNNCSTKTLEAYRTQGYWPDGTLFRSKRDGNKVLIEVEKAPNWEEEILKREEQLRLLSEKYQKALEEATEARRLEKELEEVQSELERNQAEMDEKERIYEGEVARLNRDISSRNDRIQQYRELLKKHDNCISERIKRFFGLRRELDIIPENAESLNE